MSIILSRIKCKKKSCLFKTLYYIYVRKNMEKKINVLILQKYYLNNNNNKLKKRPQMKKRPWQKICYILHIRNHGSHKEYKRAADFSNKIYFMIWTLQRQTMSKAKI